MFFSAIKYIKSLFSPDKPKFLFSKEKIQGLNLDQIADLIATFFNEEESIFILHSFSPETKPKSFWTKLPLEKRVTLLKDFVIFRCKNFNEMFSQVLEITPESGNCRGYHFGKLAVSNQEVFLIEDLSEQ
jgi:hypothetical protein